MSVPAPPSPLITPDLRRRLQQRYEEAIRLRGGSPPEHARAHELLAECLRDDPGNILYLNALFANLRQWQPQSDGKSGNWLSRWASAGWKWSRGVSSVRPALSTEYSVLGTQYLADQPIDAADSQSALRSAPELLRFAHHPGVFVDLAAACAACDHEQAEVTYLQAAIDAAPNDLRPQRMMARALTRQGQFQRAALLWRTMLAAAPDTEARQAADDLRDAHEHEAADRLLAETQAAAGEDLAIRHVREELRLSRGAQQVAIAHRRASNDSHPRAQSLAARLEAERIRQEIEILHLRCERMPGDLRLRLELSRRLKQAGNYSGAIQRLEEARSDSALAAEVFFELGECWQHLRQFEKALDFYRQAIAAEDPSEEPRPLVAALYRVGVLAAAMNRPDEARHALSRLLTIDPSYKDARERLDKLPPS